MMLSKHLKKWFGKIGISHHGLTNDDIMQLMSLLKETGANFDGFQLVLDLDVKRHTEEYLVDLAGMNEADILKVYKHAFSLGYTDRLKKITNWDDRAEKIYARDIKRRDHLGRLYGVLLLDPTTLNPIYSEYDKNHDFFKRNHGKYVTGAEFLKIQK